ncbi:hypothetical protein B0T16DRAFT_171878 [Cercophora newfieldiana]|uniref:Uncharacterized protein n=1 Tax=Cercophora newfieldiana TaxID=92897 RepID=A0AA39Y8T8_9PEZI|nr:hypothetical protein B0T16DRAFT_171878 [Cercophora newfieldiana]
MVTITELPAEILHGILIAFCKQDGTFWPPSQHIKRTLRLKLVCKRFRQALQPALFESRILGNWGQGYGRLFPWPMERHRYGADEFWHAYLVYRIRSDKTGGRFVAVRRIVENFCAETGMDEGACLETVGWLVLGGGGGRPTYRMAWRPGRQWSECEGETELRLESNLLSLAAYFNQFPVSKRLLAQGYCPVTNCGLFLTPMECAAMAGNTEMLLLFQEHLPEFEGRDDDITGADGYRSKMHASGLVGAAARGDLELVKLALYPPSRANPNSTDVLGQPFGQIDPESVAGSAIISAIESTQNWEVVQYLAAAFAERPERSYTLANSMWAFVRTGNLEIIQKLTTLDGGDSEIKKYASHHLISSVRKLHDDLVDFFLDQGVDPSGGHAYYSDDVGIERNTIEAAAATGSLSMLKKLLARGARVDKGHILGWAAAFTNAVEREHMDMVRFLLTLRTPSRRWQKKLLGEKAGRYIENIDTLDSMRSFLNETWGEKPGESSSERPDEG